jgi:GxxExxY protein
MTENELSHKIIGCAIEVHRELGGPGLLESIYEDALCNELRNNQLEVKRQLHVPVMYKGARLSRDLILDVLVNDLIIVEIKAVDEVHAVHKSQLLTYLRVANKKLGLLINFGSAYLRKGVHRVVNGL